MQVADAWSFSSCNYHWNYTKPYTLWYHVLPWQQLYHKIGTVYRNLLVLILSHFSRYVPVSQSHLILWLKVNSFTSKFCSSGLVLLWVMAIHMLQPSRIIYLILQMVESNRWNTSLLYTPHQNHVLHCKLCQSPFCTMHQVIHQFVVPL